jgi:molecular chaperone GrpE
MVKRAPSKGKAQASTHAGSKAVAKPDTSEPKPEKSSNPDVQPAPAVQPTELELLQKERDELEDRLAYMQAEFENLKKRCQRDVESRLLRAKESLFVDVLGVMDNMDRALAQSNGAACGSNKDLEDFAKGVRMIHQQMSQVLAQHGLAPIDALGQPFDPFRHEALMKVEEKDKPDGIVLEEIIKGYTLDGNVIRPTKVKVNVLPKAKGPKQE